MDPHVDDRADADMTPAADDAAVEDDVRPTANERVDSATTSLDDVPVDRALPTDEVEESDNDDFDEEAMRATVVAWLDAKLPTTDLEGTNLKQLREWTVEACPGAVRLPDLKALVKKHVTTFIQNRPRPEASDSSDSNSSSDGASEMAEKKQQGRNQASRKSNGRGNKLAKATARTSENSSSSGSSSSSSSDEDDGGGKKRKPARSSAPFKRKSTTTNKKVIRRKNSTSAKKKANKSQPPRKRRTTAPSVRRTTRRKPKSAERRSHGPKLDAHESFVKEIATTEFVHRAIDALGLDAEVIGMSVQGKEDDLVTPEWNKLLSDTTATLNGLAWTLRTGVGTVSADHVARVSRAIFAQLPIKQAAQEVEDDEDDGDEPSVPALDQSGKVKCLAHALQSLDMQAQVYKVLQGKAAPSDWNNRTVKDLYRNALAFKLSNAGPGVARLVEEELCGLNQEAGLKVSKCLKVVRTNDDAAFEPFRSGLGNLRMLWMPVDAVSLMHVLQCGPQPPPTSAAVSQYSGLELFCSGVGAVNEVRKRSLAKPKSFYFALVETACGESVDTSAMEFGDEWPTSADSLWTPGVVRKMNDDNDDDDDDLSRLGVYDGDDTGGAWKPWKFGERVAVIDSSGDLLDGGNNDACVVWRRGTRASRMTTDAHVAVFDHGQVVIRYLVEVTAAA